MRRRRRLHHHPELPTLLLLALGGCAPCGDVDALSIEGDDGVIARALRDFDAWTGRSQCLTDVAVGPLDWSARSITASSRADVFHARCAQVDARERISDADPELFAGVGIDPHAFPTERERRAEDYARACARATDQHPWVLHHQAACGGEPLPPEQAFLVDFFGGPETGLPARPTEEVRLGSLEVWGYFEIASAPGLLVLAERERVSPDTFDHRHRVRAFDLPSLTPLWTEDLGQHTTSALEPALFPGVDAVLAVNPALDGDPLAGAAWTVDRQGMRAASPLAWGFGEARVTGGAGGADGWWVALTETRWDDELGLAIEEEVLARYDPWTGLGSTVPAAERSVRGPHPAGVLLGDSSGIVQPATGITAARPWWAPYGPEAVGERLHLRRGAGPAGRLALSRPVAPAADWTLDALDCADWPTDRLVLRGLGGELAWWYDSGDPYGTPGTLHVWETRAIAP